MAGVAGLPADISQQDLSGLNGADRDASISRVSNDARHERSNWETLECDCLESTRPTKLNRGGFGFV